MPYVSSSGEISQKQPWGIAKVVAIFWGILNFFFMFFQSLINPAGNSRGGGSSSHDYRPGQGGAVHDVRDESDLATQLREAGSRLVVIDFFAEWCGPCKMISPLVEQLASQLTDVVFLKVDVDQNPEIAATYAVRSMPTFVFIKSGRKVDSFSGANYEKLKDTVYRYR